MNRLEEFKQLLIKDERTMDILRLVREVDLPDWFVAAGAIRNTIWDILEKFAEHTNLNDVDLVYFDKEKIDWDFEQETARILGEKSGFNWEIKNQARMHDIHGDKPYMNSCDAISRWPEACTCIGVRLESDNTFKICAPYGIGDVLDQIVRINPMPNYPHVESYKKRKSKQWDKIWPNLRYVD